MKERQAEGIAKAQVDGRYKGRPTSIDAGEVVRLRETMGPGAMPNNSASRSAASIGC
jgi:DNA invertase Pin-like site-specific DNA recombinase